MLVLKRRREKHTNRILWRPIKKKKIPVLRRIRLPNAISPGAGQNFNLATRDTLHRGTAEATLKSDGRGCSIAGAAFFAENRTTREGRKKKRRPPPAHTYNSSISIDIQIAPDMYRKNHRTKQDKKQRTPRSCDRRVGVIVKPWQRAQKTKATHRGVPCVGEDAALRSSCGHRRGVLGLRNKQGRRSAAGPPGTVGHDDIHRSSKIKCLANHVSGGAPPRPHQRSKIFRRHGTPETLLSKMLGEIRAVNAWGVGLKQEYPLTGLWLRRAALGLCRFTQ